MRSLAIFVVILLIIVGAAALFLVLSTPHDAPATRISTSLIREVPNSAEWFAIVPRAAALDAKLRANPVTRAAIERWRTRQQLPRPWMLGNADLIVWKSGDVVRYFVRLDPFRAFVVRMYMMAGGNIGNTLVINLPPPDPIDSTTASKIIDLASKLPPGNAVVVQRENARGAYPPIARPAATSVEVTADEIRLTSVASGGSFASSRSGHAPNFPNGAILNAAFATPPRIIGDLNRLFGTKVSDLFADGGMLCIYDVDFHKLLPRPLGVIVVPDTPQRRADVASFRDLVRSGEKDGMLLLSFDHSIEQYQKDVFEQPPAEGNEWTMRVDPARLVPILKAFGQNLGARVFAPRLFRSARDLDQWIGGLEQAKLIDAAASVDSGVETLRVRIAAK
jgi:hypothetical protein